MRFATPFVLALSLAVPATAAVAAPPVEAAFGNTVLVTFPDGRTQHLWLDQDGAYAAKGRRGQGSSGRWNLKGDEICLRQLRPFPAPIIYCTWAPQDAATVVWTAKAVNGQPVKLRLVRGRAPR